MIVKPLIEQSVNFSEPLFTDEEVENHPVTKRLKRSKRALAEELTFWEDDIGLSKPGNQASCGSCWSFPNVSSEHMFFPAFTDPPARTFLFKIYHSVIIFYFAIGCTTIFVVKLISFLRVSLRWRACLQLLDNPHH